MSSRQGGHKAASRYEENTTQESIQEAVKRVPPPNRMLPESIARIEQDIMQCCEELRRTDKVRQVVKRLEQQVSEAFEAF